MKRKWMATLTLSLLMGIGLIQLRACGNGKSPGAESDATMEPSQTHATAAYNAGSQWVLRQEGEDRPKVAIVYIHGIFGNAVNTWRADGEGQRSFHELLDLDAAVHGRADHYAFGYASKIVEPSSFSVGEAATKLYQDLRHAGVLDYQEIVIVAHSMGGLVALDALVKWRDLAERVPLVFLYSTPQEGAQIAELGARLLANPALKDTLRMDGNHYLQTLDDLWKNLAASEMHPHVRCAYEKRPTWNLGVIVPRTSSTRFCEGASAAIDADHIGITKPEGPGSSALVPLVIALEELVLGDDIRPQLEMPDFVTEGDASAYTMNNREVTVRLKNAGKRGMKYKLESESNYFSGSPSIATIGANTTVDLRLFILVGATEQQYRFTLTSADMSRHTVTVKVPQIAALREAEQRLVAASEEALQSMLRDPDSRERLRGLDSDAVEDRIVEVVQRQIADATGLPDEVTWTMTAHFMNEANWHGLAVRALRNVERVAPQGLSAGNIRSIASTAAAGAGIRQIFRSQPVAVGSPAVSFDSLFQGQEARALASLMNGIRALQPYALSLQGDLFMREGNRQAALDSWRQAEMLRSFPSTAARIESVEASLQRQNAATVQLGLITHSNSELPQPSAAQPTSGIAPSAPIRLTVEDGTSAESVALKYSIMGVLRESDAKAQPTPAQVDVRRRQVEVRNEGVTLNLLATKIDTRQIQSPAGVSIAADHCGNKSLAPGKSCQLVLACAPRPEKGRPHTLITAEARGVVLRIDSDAVCGSDAG